MNGIGKLSVLLLISSCLVGISATKCQYCQKDFNVLGRHDWRCKSRVSSSKSCEGRQPAQPIHENARTAGDSLSSHTISTDQASTTTVSYFTCTCGRRCKGRRGLKSHQRCCTTHQTLASITEDKTNDPMNESNTTTTTDINNDDNSIGNNHTPGSTNESVSNSSCKPGLKLPKTPTQWKEANEFFHYAFLDILDTNTKKDDLNIWVLSIQDRVYDYFASTYGNVNSTTQSDLYDKYNNTSINNMKRILKKLKHENANIDEIKFLSKLIRKKTNKSSEDIDPKTLESDLHNTFWKTWRGIFNKATNSLPTFSVQCCTEYFWKTLAGHPSTLSSFKIPSWIPKLPDPVASYNDTLPTYKEVAQAVRRAKASASGSVFDQLSIIILKRCPILRNVLHRIIVECWSRKQSRNAGNKEQPCLSTKRMIPAIRQTSGP